MDRVNRICRHPLWLESVAALERLEQDRVFCRHTWAHFLDVARLGYIEILENSLPIAKEELYAAALLHDIGRHLQYTKGIPHERASVMLAGEILPDCNFTVDEQQRIQDAILSHRGSESGNDLAGVLCRADKASRICLFCPAEKECNWSKEKKNWTIKG